MRFRAGDKAVTQHVCRDESWRGLDWGGGHFCCEALSVCCIHAGGGRGSGQSRGCCVGTSVPRVPCVSSDQGMRCHPATLLRPWDPTSCPRSHCLCVFM